MSTPFKHLLPRGRTLLANTDVKQPRDTTPPIKARRKIFNDTKEGNCAANLDNSVMQLSLDPNFLHGEGIESGKGHVAEAVLVVQLVRHLSQVIIHGHVISTLQQDFFMSLENGQSVTEKNLRGW